LRLLADRLVELEHVGSISYETIRRTLNHYRLKAVGCLATESRGTRLKPSEVFPAQSRLQGSAGAVILKP
jgi:hypothetical protein